MDSSRKETEVTPVFAPIDRIGHVGIRIRKLLLSQILAGTQLLLYLQARRTNVRTTVMKWFSFLGLEDFFTPLIIILLWVVDSRFGIVFTVLLGSGFYISSFLKCLLCLPRPPVPPVKPLVEENNDWAFPSNHSINGVIMPWFIWCYTQTNYPHLSVPATMLICVLLVVWSFGIMTSRLYLGVHSPVDVVAGIVIGAMLLTVFDNVYVKIYRLYSENTTWFSFSVVAVHMILLYLHPRCWPETASFGETVIPSSRYVHQQSRDLWTNRTLSAVGMLASRKFGFGRSPSLALLERAAGFNIATTTLIYSALSRVVIGTTVLLGCRVLAKYFFRWCFYHIMALIGLKAYSFSVFSKENKQTTKHYTDEYHLPPENEKVPDNHPDISDSERRKNCFSNSTSEMRGHWSSLKPANRPYDVDLPTRYAVYTVVGWLVTEVCPLLFEYLGV